MKKILFVVFSLIFTSCGFFEDNKIEHKKNSFDDDKIFVENMQKKWDHFSNALGIKNNKFSLTKEDMKNRKVIRDKMGAELSLTKEDMKNRKVIRDKMGAELYKQSSLLSNPDILKDISKDWFKNKNLSKIKEISSFEFFQNSVDHEGKEIAAKIYVMKYKIFVDQKAEKSDDRQAFLIIPDNFDENTVELIVYGHSNDRGLWRTQVGRDLDRAQEKHIIIAPAFAGEPICEKGYLESVRKECKKEDIAFKAVGQSNPWVNDVDDFLALTDYMKKIHKKNDSVSQKIRGDLKGAKFNRNNIKAFGSSRGGLVAALSVVKDTIFSQYERRFPSYNRLTLLASPTTILHGRFRMILEDAVKGTLEYTEFVDRLPCMEQLKDLYKAYRLSSSKEEEEKELKKAKRETLVRDFSILAPALVKSIAKIKSKNPGYDFKVDFLYGLDDQIVDYGQGEFPEEVIKGTAKHLDFDDISSHLNVHQFKASKEAKDKADKKEKYHLSEAFWKSRDKSKNTPRDILADIFN